MKFCFFFLTKYIAIYFLEYINIAIGAITFQQWQNGRQWFGCKSESANLKVVHYVLLPLPLDK